MTGADEKTVRRLVKDHHGSVGRALKQARETTQADESMSGPRLATLTGLPSIEGETEGRTSMADGFERLPGGVVLYRSLNGCTIRNLDQEHSVALSTMTRMLADKADPEAAFQAMINLGFNLPLRVAAVVLHHDRLFIGMSPRASVDRSWPILLPTQNVRHGQDVHDVCDAMMAAWPGAEAASIREAVMTADTTPEIVLGPGFSLTILMPISVPVPPASVGRRTAKSAAHDIRDTKSNQPLQISVARNWYRERLVAIPYRLVLTSLAGDHRSINQLLLAANFPPTSGMEPLMAAALGQLLKIGFTSHASSRALSAASLAG